MPNIQCHYDVLGVDRDADASTIKKSHRKLALKYHPDKNLDDETASEKFRLVQQAYECLSDPKERKWYDDHREAILAGWSTSDSPDNINMLFEVVHYMHPGCYSGYHDDEGGFYDVYKACFEGIVQCELRQSEKLVELPTDFGDSCSGWDHVQRFYQEWESFGTLLNFAWEDKYNANEDAPNRRVKRLMEDENKKARRAAKKLYNQDILTLVSFIKRRDPRVIAKQEEMKRKKIADEKKRQEEEVERKKEQQKAREVWKEEAQRAMEEAEEADRIAGRVRLADLEDDYEYAGSKKKKRGKGKKKKRWVEDEFDDPPVEEASLPVQQSVQPGDDTSESNIDLEEPVSEAQEEGNAKNDDVSAEDVLASDEAEEVFSDSSSSEPDFWRCECCRKDFKSEGQMQNHMKSKKHKAAYKKYQAKMKDDDIVEGMIGDLNI